MAIDPGLAVGARLARKSFAWSRDDAILYALGVGAGVPPTDRSELSYVLESGLQVLPTFGVIPARRSIEGFAEIPGLSHNAANRLHGEQDLEIRGPIPVAGKVENVGEVIGVFDKGNAALVVLEVKSTLEGHGEPLFINRWSLFLRGEGGFGGASGPRPSNLPPSRAPDHVFESKTIPQQALLYRLSGDKNPLHADPEYAVKAGFERPILHGLCSYGIVCKGVVDEVLAGDTTRVTRFQARFAGVVFPGETILTKVWQDGCNISIEATTKERNTPVISNSAITTH